MSIQVAVLWPLPAVSQVSCQLSETSDSRQRWHDQRAGPCWTGQPSALRTDRHVAVISLWQAVSAAGEPPTSTRPLSSHLTTNRGEALNSQLGIWTPLPPPLLLYSTSIVAAKLSRLLYLWNAHFWLRNSVALWDILIKYLLKGKWLYLHCFLYTVPAGETYCKEEMSKDTLTTL